MSGNIDSDKYPHRFYNLIRPAVACLCHKEIDELFRKLVRQLLFFSRKEIKKITCYSKASKSLCVLAGLIFRNFIQHSLSQLREDERG